uniref:Heterochromatin protein 1-binding protein 3 n=1 Tax=Microcebus murinus TaxID=30608 RepID=A0A8C5VDI9_MICMU
MAAEVSQGELVHPKALPLIVGAHLIHMDKLGEKVEDTVNSTRETPPKSKLAEGEEEKPEPDMSSEESVSTVEEHENETLPAISSEAQQPKGEPENEEKEESKPSEETKKDEKDQPKEKEKKVKKTIPSWATLSASQLARQAIKACFQKSGASVVAIRKYIIHKYPSLELERRSYLLKQIKGKGASGSFVVVQKSRKTHQKSRNRKKRSSAVDPEPQVKLEDVLSLAFTPSYSLIGKYVSQYYPKLRVDTRPQLLKNLEQITGKGVLGTFQLKKSGEKPLLGGSLIEYAILSAIAAMNKLKTCSTTALKKYVLENHPGTNSNYQMDLLKKTLQKCKKNGWMEQISGKGFSCTFQLFLFPKKEPDDSKDEDGAGRDEDEDESSEDSEDEEPPPKRRLQKKTPAKSPGKAASKVSSGQWGETRPLPKKALPKAKTLAKKARSSPSVIKKPGGGSSKKPVANVRKEVKLPGKGKSTMKKTFKAKK